MGEDVNEYRKNPIYSEFLKSIQARPGSGYAGSSYSSDYYTPEYISKYTNWLNSKFGKGKY